MHDTDPLPVEVEKNLEEPTHYLRHEATATGVLPSEI